MSVKQQKLNCAIYYGTSFDRDTYKLKIIENLSKSWNVFVANRYKTLDVPKHDTVRPIYAYDSPVFTQVLSKEMVSESEKWLGLPFIYILRRWYNWDEGVENSEKALSKRFDAVAKYVMFWRDFFERNKVDIYIGALESTYPEIVALEVAKKLGIPVVILAGGRLTNSFMVYDENFVPVCVQKPNLAERQSIFDLLKKRYVGRSTPEYPATKSDAQKYSNISTNPLYKIRRFFWYRKKYQSEHEFDKYRTVSASGLARNFLKHVIRRQYAKFLYANPDMTKEHFFLFPLHYTEEALLTVNEAFTNQVGLIEHIAASLPLGTKLLVKPHPHWSCVDISIGDVRKIKNLRNVILVSPDMNTYDLIRNSIAVLTINSTVGFEALVLGKPVITFGHDVNGIGGAATAVNDMLSLPRIMVAATRGQLTPSNEKVRDVVTQYYTNLIFVDGVMGLEYKLTDGDSTKIANALISAAKYVISQRKSRRGLNRVTMLESRPSYGGEQ